MKAKKKTKFVLGRSSPVIKAAVVAALILSITALVALHGSIGQVRSQYDALRRHAMVLESGNHSLVERIDELGTLESAIRIAMEELGLIFPDSTVYIPGN